MAAINTAQWKQQEMHKYWMIKTEIPIKKVQNKVLKIQILGNILTSNRLKWDTKIVVRFLNWIKFFH